jgi:hypothetical protein
MIGLASPLHAASQLPPTMVVSHGNTTCGLWLTRTGLASAADCCCAVPLGACRAPHFVTHRASRNQHASNSTSPRDPALCGGFQGARSVAAIYRGTVRGVNECCAVRRLCAQASTLLQGAVEAAAIGRRNVGAAGEVCVDQLRIGSICACSSRTIYGMRPTKHC